MPKINEMLFKLEVFQYDMSLYLNMGYHPIWHSKNTSNLCTIIIQGGKYRYKRLPMGVATLSEIFQNKLMTYFMDLDLSLRT